MRADTKAVEKLKAQILEDLSLMRADDYEEYWRQAKWKKPDLVELAKDAWVRLPQKVGNINESVRVFAPVRYAITQLDPQLVASASRQLDPFGWLLGWIDVAEWSEFCRAQRTPWMTRVWLAAASQLLAERKLIFKAHGWSGTWETLRRNPHSVRAAENFHLAELRHSRGKLRKELQAIRVNGLSESSRRRLRRSKNEMGKRAGVSPMEKFMVQYWLELPDGVPGLCFFSNTALHDLLELLKKNTGDDWASKKVRTRLRLIQAGVKEHLIDQVVGTGKQLKFIGARVPESWVLKKSQTRSGRRTF